MVAERRSFRGQALQGILDLGIMGLLDLRGEGDAADLQSCSKQAAVGTIQHLT